MIYYDSSFHISPINQVGPGRETALAHHKNMINGKQFKMVTDKFMSSPTVQNARVQVCLPNGEFYDIKGIQLMENKLFGVRETHRLVITIEPEKWRMGRVMKKV